MDFKYRRMINIEIKKGETQIKWEPAGRYVVVSDSEKDNEDSIRAKANGLILAGDLSDKERMEYGGESKAASLANKTSEEQGSYTIIATGPDCNFCKIGDVVIFSPGCQGTSIKVEDKFYLQLGEYDVLGRFTK